MRRLFWLCIVCSSFSPLGYGKGLPKASKKICRCEENGPCELSPVFNKLINKNLSVSSVSKTKERAYVITEKFRMAKEGTEVTYTQGGCDHPFYEFKFETQQSGPLTDFKLQLSTLNTLLRAIAVAEAPEMIEAIKKALASLSDSRPRKPEDAPICEQETPPKGKVLCFASVVPNFSWLEITIERTSDNKTTYVVSETQAL